MFIQDTMSDAKKQKLEHDPMTTPTYFIGTTTTFWSQQDLVKLVCEKNPTLQLQEVNEEFSLDFESTQKCQEGMLCYLKYGNVRVLEFVFGGIDFKVDWPKWEELFDKTNTFKYRLYINNKPSWCGSEGSRPPVTIYIRPDQYDPGAQLEWRYEKNEEGRLQSPHAIEICRVDGDARQVIHTLRGEDFGSRGENWLSNVKPIVMQKHETYILICPSDHFARAWDILKSYTRDSWLDPVPNFRKYTMSQDETAWISKDSEYIKRYIFKDTRKAHI